MLTLRPCAAAAALFPRRRALPVEGLPPQPRRQARPHPPLVIWLPAALVAVAMVVPLLYLVLRASQAGADVADLVFRDRTALLLRQTAILAVSVAATTSLIAVPLAWLTVRTDLPLRRFWATVAALPLVIPSYVGALTIVAALGPRGLLQDVAGVERLPEIYGFFGAWLSLSLFTYPYVYLGVRAALRGLDPSLDEAARCLGYGAWRTFFACTLPQLRPGIAAGALLVALYTVSEFGVVTLLRYDVLTRAVYVQYRSSFDRSAAATLALILVACAALLLVAEARIRGRATHYRLGSGAARQARLVPLGRWRYPALAYCAGVIGLALGLPLSVLIYWLSRGLSRGTAFDGLGTATFHSLSVGGWAAVAATLAALPVATLAVRYPGRSGSVAAGMSYLGYALPGIVIALAFVFIGANYLTPIYQTVPLLVLAYVVQFLPLAIGATRLSLLQVSPRLEEAARNLGKSSLGAIASVTVPLAMPGVSAGMALVFLTVVKELPVTLLLSPTGYKTLATTIWTASDASAFAEAAAPALLLVALSAVPTLFLVARDRGTGAT